MHDAARFLSLHLGDGAANGHRLLSAESAVAMRTLTTDGAKLTTGACLPLATALPLPRVVG